MAISVVNHKYIKNHRPAGTVVYIGRPNPAYDYQRSPLANEWSHLKNSRAKHHVGSVEEAVECYRRWLLAEVKNTRSAAFLELERLAEIAEQADLELCCWCVGPTGEGACQGFVVKRAVEWRMRERRKAPTTPPAGPSPDESGSSGGAHEAAVRLVAAAARPAAHTHVS